MMFEEPEGATPLSPDDMAGLKFAHITTRDELNQLEQSNIAQGFMWLGRRRGGGILDSTFVKTLHTRLFGDVWGWAGVFRLRGMNIGIEPHLIPEQLHMLLGNARYWAEEDIYSPLEAAARFHHRMVEIHLFTNGNGRHSRIATDIYLNDYFDHPVIDWEAGYDLQTQNERRDNYINALRQADRNEFNLLLEFVGVN